MSLPAPRDATEDDMAAVAAIYAPYVLDATTCFEVTPPSAEEMARRRRAYVDESKLVFVVQPDGDGGAILGYAYLCPFRSRPAYAEVAEVSVYVRADAHGRGLGTRLMADVLARGARLGVRQVFSVLGTRETNEASVRLHEKCGFETVGTLRRVGRKHGRVLDRLLMQVDLETHEAFCDCARVPPS